MKKTFSKLLTILLIIAVFITSCDNSPDALSAISIESGYESEIRIEDYENGVELPKANVIAHYIKGGSKAVNAEYCITAKDGDSASYIEGGMTALGKGIYTITATYTEGSATKTATYTVNVTGDERLLINELSGTDLYAGDNASNVSAIAVIEEADGTRKDVDASTITYKLTDSEGNEKNKETDNLDTGTYILTVISGSLEANANFVVSKGYLPISFTISEIDEDGKVNKDADTLDLTDLTVTVYYEDELNPNLNTTKTITLFDGDAIKENVAITLDENSISDYSKVDLSSYGKGQTATIKVSVEKAFAQAVKSDGNPTSFTDFVGEMEAQSKKILVTVNPSISNLSVITNEKTESLAYVEKDTVELSNITFSYDDGTGADELSITSASEGVTVTFNGDNQNSSFNLIEGENAVSVTYGGATASTTINAEKIAIAKAITAANGIQTEYRVNPGEGNETVSVSIPDNLELKVTYEDGETGTVKVTDKNKVTFAFERQDIEDYQPVSTMALLTENNTISGDDTIEFDTGTSGKYALTITYSSPSDFTHRQSSSVSDENRLQEGASLTYEHTEAIDIKRSATITDLNIAIPSDVEYKEHVEDDTITPDDVTFKFTNIYGDEDISLNNASQDNFTLEYSLDKKEWTKISNEGYALTDATTYFRVSYYADDTDNENHTVSTEECTIEPKPLLTPSSISIVESLSETINMEDKNGQSYTVKDGKLSVKLTYADETTAEETIEVIGSNNTVNENFFVTVNNVAYDEFKYSYDANNLGEKEVKVTLKNERAYTKRPVKEVTDSAVEDPSASYNITIQRNPIIKDAAYKGEATVYNHSVLALSDFSFIYVNNIGEESNITLSDEGVTDIYIGEAVQTDNVTLPDAYEESYTVAFKYENTDGTLTISEVTEDVPAELVLAEDESIKTSYKATSPNFTYSLNENVTVKYLSGWEDKNVPSSSISFKIGEVSITEGTAITEENENTNISVIYSDQGIGVYKNNEEYATTIAYDSIYGIKVTRNNNVTKAIVKTDDPSSINAKQFVSSVILVFESGAEEEYEGEYALSVEGEPNAVRESIQLVPTVSINEETVEDAENAITVQIVDNKYELAAYDSEAIVIDSESTDFKIPEIFNHVADGTAIFFLGYYDEEGDIVTYGEESSDIYIKTSGTPYYTTKTSSDNTEYSVPTDFTVSNKIVSTKGAVTLHPILMPANEVVTVEDSVITDDLDYSSIILGIPNSITKIGSNAFKGNTNIKMIVFEKDSSLETIGERALNAMDIRYIMIPNSVKTMEVGALGDSVEGAQVGYLEFEENAQLSDINGDYVFTNGNFGNILIPSSLSTVPINSFTNSKYPMTVVIEERNTALTLPDNLFNNNNTSDTGIGIVFIPKNVNLSSNTFNGINVDQIVIDGQQNGLEFGKTSPWGASEDATVTWLIESEIIATASDYPAYLEEGESFTATLSITDKIGTEKTETVEFTAPNRSETEDGTFTLSYTIDGEKVEIEFTATIVDAKISNAEDLSSFLSSNTEKVGYVTTSFTTSGFNIDNGKSLYGANGVEIGLTSLAPDSDSYVIISGNNVIIKTLTFYLSTNENDEEHYLMKANNVANLRLEDVVLDNSRTYKAGGSAYFDHVLGSTFNSVDFLGNVPLVPVWLNDSQLTLNNCEFGQNNDGVYAYARFMLAGERNNIMISGDTPYFDRWASNANNNISHVIFSGTPNLSNNWSPKGSFTVEDVTYYYYEPSTT